MYCCIIFRIWQKIQSQHRTYDVAAATAAAGRTVLVHSSTQYFRTYCTAAVRAGVFLATTVLYSTSIVRRTSYYTAVDVYCSNSYDDVQRVRRTVAVVRRAYRQKDKYISSHHSSPGFRKLKERIDFFGSSFFDISNINRILAAKNNI